MKTEDNMKYVPRICDACDHSKIARVIYGNNKNLGFIVGSYCTRDGTEPSRVLENTKFCFYTDDQYLQDDWYLSHQVDPNEVCDKWEFTD